MIGAAQREAAAEIVGTYCVVFVCAGVICADVYAAGGIGLAGIALAQGLALTAVITIFRPVSGAHVNPAVTFAALLCGRIQPARAGMYVASQMLGACAAGLSLLIVFSPELWASVALGSPQLGVGVEPGTAIMLEAILTFVLVLSVLRPVAASESHLAPAVAAGGALAAGALLGGAISGAGLNPARAFGPAFAAGVWESHYVFWLGPLAGGAAAAGVIHLVGRLDPDPEERAFARELEERDQALEAAARKLEARSRLRVVEESAEPDEDRADS